jgi:hypothetical protein
MNTANALVSRKEDDFTCAVADAMQEVEHAHVMIRAARQKEAEVTKDLAMFGARSAALGLQTGHPLVGLIVAGVALVAAGINSTMEKAKREKLVDALAVARLGVVHAKLGPLRDAMATLERMYARHSEATALAGRHRWTFDGAEEGIELRCDAFATAVGTLSESGTTLERVRELIVVLSNWERDPRWLPAPEQAVRSQGSSPAPKRHWPSEVFELGRRSDLFSVSVQDLFVLRAGPSTVTLERRRYAMISRIARQRLGAIIWPFGDSAQHVRAAHAALERLVPDLRIALRKSMIYQAVGAYIVFLLLAGCAAYLFAAGL